MTLHELAGKPAPPEILVDLPKLVTAYYTLAPDPAEVAHRVAFGTSGHRGSALSHSFNEAHILATTQAICEYRESRGYTGPLYLGRDTHALSEPAHATALEVLVGNGVETRVAARDEWVPTPAVSRAILAYNAGRDSGLADGIVITPSHNPPEDGGFKYNPPEGGPADTDVTQWIETRANELLAAKLSGVKRVPFERARRDGLVSDYDFTERYVAELGSVIDMPAIAASGLKIGADPLGGSGIGYWDPIVERYGLNLEVVNRRVDATFSFMRVDKDGKIRMDCSSPSAMAGLVELKDRYDIAFGNDTDYDRHGIVTKTGLMNPNHYLSVAIDYLFRDRRWGVKAGVGKTLVSTSLIDRVAKARGLSLVEVPVGFKWFVAGLLDGSIGFCGEESAGASFLRRDGSPWVTDKDGIILDLLAAEIAAKTGKSPSEHYDALTAELGEPCYERIDAPVTPEQKAVLKKLSPNDVSASELAGERIEQKLTEAPGNGAAIGGLKVVTENGWFAARPSGTEAVYKIYAESFRGREHLERIQTEAREIVASAFAAAGAS